MKKTEQKNLLYISLYRIQKRERNGVAKKISNQINAFIELGFDVSYTFIENETLFLLYKGEKIFLFTINTSPYKNISRLFNILRRMITKKEINRFSYVYIRKSLSSISSIRFLKSIKQLGGVNLIEIPVFPYKGEKTTTLKSTIGYFQDIILNKLFYRKFVDYIINYNGYKSIFNTKALPINNGIDIDNILLNTNEFSEDKINIGTVSSMAYWHGYDRIIEGLRSYYNTDKKIKVYLHLIGDGPEVEHYKELCEKYKLSDKVFFYGQLGGEKLDSAFNNIDVGIGALGIFRKNLNNVSSIKTAEFLARGIPMIYSGNEEGLTGNEDFVLQVPNEDTAVSIEEVIAFYQHVKKDKDVRIKMRELAESKYSWKKQYEEIFNHLNYS